MSKNGPKTTTTACYLTYGPYGISLQDTNRSRLADNMSNSQEDKWEHEPVFPRYKNQYLDGKVQLANYARNNNMDKILADVVKKKADIFQSKSLQVRNKWQCTNDQVKQNQLALVFDEIPQAKNTTDITDEDITKGFMIYSALVFCAESSYLYQFLATLISNQSARTILQVIVNTIQSEDDMDDENKKKFNHIYLELDRILDLQYGKILLATATPYQLEDMIAKDWPFFGNYTEEVKECLHGDSCQVVQHLVQALGDLTVSNKPIYFHYRIRWPCEQCKQPSSSRRRLSWCTNS